MYMSDMSIIRHNRLAISLISFITVYAFACEVDHSTSDSRKSGSDMSFNSDLGRFSSLRDSDMNLGNDINDELGGSEEIDEVQGGEGLGGGNESISGEQGGEEVAQEDMGAGESGMEMSPLSKSLKRGIAYNLTSVRDLEALATGISWWYNWSPQYDSNVSSVYRELGVDWIPMTWNGNNPEEIRAFLNNHPEVRYLLTYNEPNFQDQANMTPAYAASLWPTFEQIAEEYDLELVGPALNYCGHCVVVNGAPLESNYTIWMDMFLDEFRTQFGREPHMDYTALHWYDYGLEDQVNEIVMRYGKPVWLTEFALWRHEDWATDDLERQWLIDMVAFLEAHPMVHRYAWFTGRRPDFPKINLLAEDGVLTPLGEAYVNAPYVQLK